MGIERYIRSGALALVVIGGGLLCVGGCSGRGQDDGAQVKVDPQTVEEAEKSDQFLMEQSSPRGRGGRQGS